MKLLPPLAPGDMLLSGLRPVRDVEAWWLWTQGEARRGVRRLLGARGGSLRHGRGAHVLSVHRLVAPRDFLARYGGIDEPELGFLEYKVPAYAQAFGIPLVPDTCFRPWWPEEPATSQAGRTASLVHAWPTPVRLPVMLYESLRPGGRRAFHPYHGIYPHDLASLPESVRRRRRAPVPRSPW